MEEKRRGGKRESTASGLGLRVQPKLSQRFARLIRGTKKEKKEKKKEKKKREEERER